jgi:hypothetical protein
LISAEVSSVLNSYESVRLTNEELQIFIEKSSREITAALITAVTAIHTTDVVQTLLVYIDDLLPSK